MLTWVFVDVSANGPVGSWIASIYESMEAGRQCPINFVLILFCSGRTAVANGT